MAKDGIDWTRDLSSLHGLNPNRYRGKLNRRPQSHCRRNLAAEITQDRPARAFYLSLLRWVERDVAGTHAGDGSRPPLTLETRGRGPLSLQKKI